MKKSPGAHARVEMTITEVGPRRIDRALARLEAALDGLALEISRDFVYDPAVTTVYSAAEEVL